jgi:hypothetical protein
VSSGLEALLVGAVAEPRPEPTHRARTARVARGVGLGVAVPTADLVDPRLPILFIHVMVEGDVPCYGARRRDIQCLGAPTPHGTRRCMVLPRDLRRRQRPRKSAAATPLAVERLTRLRGAMPQLCPEATKRSRSARLAREDDLGVLELVAELLGPRLAVLLGHVLDRGLEDDVNLLRTTRHAPRRWDSAHRPSPAQADRRRRTTEASCDTLDRAPTLRFAASAAR